MIYWNLKNCISKEMDCGSQHSVVHGFFVMKSMFIV